MKTTAILSMSMAVAAMAYGGGAKSCAAANDFSEGNSLLYTWHVMHDPPGLIEAMGGAPQVPRVALKVGRERTFVVRAEHLSKENKYVKSVTLNGRPITDWKIRHADVMKGGELVFEMTGAVGARKQGRCRR